MCFKIILERISGAPIAQNRNLFGLLLRLSFVYCGQNDHKIMNIRHWQWFVCSWFHSIAGLRFKQIFIFENIIHGSSNR